MMHSGVTAGRNRELYQLFIKPAVSSHFHDNLKDVNWLENPKIDQKFFLLERGKMDLQLLCKVTLLADFTFFPSVFLLLGSPLGPHL